MRIVPKKFSRMMKRMALWKKGVKKFSTVRGVEDVNGGGGDGGGGGKEGVVGGRGMLGMIVVVVVVVVMVVCEAGHEKERDRVI